MQVLIRAGICDTDETFAAFAKGAARDADDLLLVEQAVAELDAAQAEAADVGKDIERTVRAVAADAVDLGEAVAGCCGGAQRPDAALRRAPDGRAQRSPRTGRGRWRRR